MSLGGFCLETPRPRRCVHSYDLKMHTLVLYSDMDTIARHDSFPKFRHKDTQDMYSSLYLLKICIFDSYLLGCYSYMKEFNWQNDLKNNSFLSKGGHNILYLIHNLGA